MSEFGKGLTYCLGLFLCHSERDYSISDDFKKYLEEADERFIKRSKVKEFSHTTEMWFNAASDHFYDLEIPETLPKSLKKRLTKLIDKAINWGHGFNYTVTKKDKKWAIQEAKDLLRLIDNHFGIKTERGDWE